MQHIKPYQIFENDNKFGPLNDDQKNLLKDCCVDGSVKKPFYWNPKTKKVDLNSKFEMSSYSVAYFGGLQKFIEIFETIPFGEVKDFNIAEFGLETMKNMPDIVVGDFNAIDNNFVNLKGSPKKIIGNCYLSDNSKLETLEGGPEVVERSYNVSYCKNLKSLKGSPKYCSMFIGKRLFALESLENGPVEIGYSFHADNTEGHGRKTGVTLYYDAWNKTGNLKRQQVAELVRMFKMGFDEKSIKLLSTLITENDMQNVIDLDPSHWAIEMSKYWKEIKKIYPRIKFPNDLEDDIETLSDLSDLGF